MASPYTEEYTISLLGEEFWAKVRDQSGPQTKLCPRVWAKVLDAMWLSVPIRTAVACAGITDQTLTNWCKTWPELAETFKAAQPEGDIERVKRLHEMDSETAIKWLLERRNPDYRPPPKQTEVRMTSPPVEFIFRAADVQGMDIPVPPEISGEVKAEEAADDQG